MKTDAVTQVYAVFSHGQFLQLIKTDMLTVLFDPGFNGMTALSNADLSTSAGVNCLRRVFLSQVHP
jgi:hypothetical protein